MLEDIANVQVREAVQKHLAYALILQRLSLIIPVNGPVSKGIRAMREIITGLWPLQQPSPDMGLGVFLDVESAPAMAGLTEGEHVKLVEPPELEVRMPFFTGLRQNPGSCFGLPRLVIATRSKSLTSEERYRGR